MLHGNGDHVHKCASHCGKSWVYPFSEVIYVATAAIMSVVRNRDVVCFSKVRRFFPFYGGCPHLRETVERGSTVPLVFIHV